MGRVLRSVAQKKDSKDSSKAEKQIIDYGSSESENAFGDADLQQNEESNEADGVVAFSNSDDDDSDASDESDDEDAPFPAKGKRGRLTAKKNLKKVGPKPKKAKVGGKTQSDKNDRLRFTRTKFRNLQDMWTSEPVYEEVKLLTEKYGNLKKQFSETFLKKLESNLKDASKQSLLQWMNSRKISLSCFLPITLIDDVPSTSSKKKSQFSLELPPFNARVASNDNLQLNDLELYFNMSSAVWQCVIAPGSHLSRFADGSAVIDLPIAIGMNRIGWPIYNSAMNKSKDESSSNSDSKQQDVMDYEIKHNPHLEYYLSPPPSTTNCSSSSSSFSSQSSSIPLFGNDYARDLGKMEFHDNLLPIFCLKHKFHKTNNITATHSHQVSYFVSLEKRGSVRSMEWNKCVQSNSIIVGLLAVVTGDGNCNIFLLPQSPSSSKKTASASSSSSDTSLPSYLTIPVINEKQVLLCSLPRLESPVVRVMSASWNPTELFELCCGMSDGSVIVYSIEETVLSGSLQVHFFLFLS
jgi:hypothetical protein